MSYRVEVKIEAEQAGREALERLEKRRSLDDAGDVVISNWPPSSYQNLNGLF
jgi:hypothetical protein